MLIALLTLAMDLHSSNIPVHFEPNQGQIFGLTEWTARAKGGTLYIKGSAIAFETSEPAKKPRILRFVGVSPTKGEGLEPTGGYSNYFDGRDEKNWRSGIPHYAKVRYESVYKGIDLVYYATPDRQIEYDLEVQPNADLNQIELSFDGFDKITVDAAGDLNLHSGQQVIKQHRPRVSQNGQDIACNYVLLGGNRVQLETGGYDQTLPLTVDPALEFATYFGGPGHDSFGGVAIDPAGNIVLAGTSETPSNPTLDPFQQTNTVLEMAFIAKLTPSGDKLLYYSTIRSNVASATSGLSLDASGSPILYGITWSSDFPLKNPFQTTISAFFFTGFVTKFTTDGKSIIHSSYFGGSGGTDSPYGGVVDADGAFIFTGSTESHDIPTKNALQPHFGGGTSDCFVAKLDPTGSLIFSTYFGGSGTDYCRPIALGPGGSIYFGSTSWSEDLPLKNPIQTTLTPRNGYNTPFIARLSADGSKLEYGTFLGGRSPGSIASIALNSKGEIYLGGSGYSQPLYATVNAFQTACEPYVCGIIMKLDPTGQKILNSTFLTGSAPSGVSSLAIGTDDSVYILGSANSGDFPTLNSLFPFAPDQYIGDGFLAKFLGDLRTLVFSTYLGPSTLVRQGMTLDSAGRIYLAGSTSSAAYPVKSAFQKVFGGGGSDGLLLRLSDSTVAAVSPLIAAPGQVQLKYLQGSGAAIVPQSVQVTSTDAPVSFTASANASWVTVLPQTATTPVALSVGASPLAPGNYTATLTLRPTSGEPPLSIPVALKVLFPAPVLTSVDPSFVALGTDDTTITFHGTGFTLDTQILLGGSGVFGYPTVYVDGQTVICMLPYLVFTAEGSYVFSAINPQSDVSASVTMSVGRLTPVITSVVNAASQLSGSLAPGELIQINGTNFGPAAQLTVTVAGVLAKVVSSTDIQATVIVPSQVQGALADVVVTSGALPSLSSTLPLAAVALGVFTADGSGVGGALFSGTASPGSTITLFGTGMADLTLLLKVKIVGEDAAVTSLSPVDGQPGWFQVSVTIPSDLPTDAPVPIVFCVGGLRSQDGVTLALTAPQ